MMNYRARAIQRTLNTLSNKTMGTPHEQSNTSLTAANTNQSVQILSARKASSKRAQRLLSGANLHKALPERQQQPFDKRANLYHKGQMQSNKQSAGGSLSRQTQARATASQRTLNGNLLSSRSCNPQTLSSPNIQDSRRQSFACLNKSSNRSNDAPAVSQIRVVNRDALPPVNRKNHQRIHLQRRQQEEARLPLKRQNLFSNASGTQQKGLNVDQTPSCNESLQSIGQQSRRTSIPLSHRSGHTAPDLSLERINSLETGQQLSSRLRFNNLKQQSTCKSKAMASRPNPGGGQVADKAQKQSRVQINNQAIESLIRQQKQRYQVQETTRPVKLANNYLVTRHAQDKTDFDAPTQLGNQIYPSSPRDTIKVKNYEVDSGSVTSAGIICQNDNEEVQTKEFEIEQTQPQTHRNYSNYGHLMQKLDQEVRSLELDSGSQFSNESPQVLSARQPYKRPVRLFKSNLNAQNIQASLQQANTIQDPLMDDSLVDKSLSHGRVSLQPEGRNFNTRIRSGQYQPGITQTMLKKQSHSLPQSSAQKLRQKMYAKDKQANKVDDGCQNVQWASKQLDMSMQIEENDLLSKSGASSSGLDELAAFSPHLLSHSIGTLQSSFTQRVPPCDRSHVVKCDMNPFSPQPQESQVALSSLENSIQKMVPNLPLQSKNSKKSCAQKLMENTFIKKKSGVALKFPPGFFAEGSFGSNLSNVESRSSPRSRISRISTVDGKKSLNLQQRHSFALDKVRNLQVQHQASHPVHVTLSPPTSKEEDLVRIENNIPESLRLRAQNTDEGNKNPPGRNRPSFQIFTQRKSKIRLLSPANNPNLILSDQNSLRSSVSNEKCMIKKNLSKRTEQNKQFSQSILQQLQLMQQNSNSRDIQDTQDQIEQRPSSRNLDQMLGCSKQAACDTFCDRVKQNIITNGIGHLKRSVESKSSKNRPGSPRQRQEPQCDDSHTITTSLETAATAHALRDRANKAQPTIGFIRAGGKLQDLTEQAQIDGSEPAMQSSPQKPIEMTPLKLNAQNATSHAVSRLSPSREFERSGKQIADLRQSFNQTEQTPTEQTLGQDGIMTFGNFATLIEDNNTQVR